MAATCGSCKQTNQSVAHIRQCSSARYAHTPASVDAAVDRTIARYAHQTSAPQPTPDTNWQEIGELRRIVGGALVRQQRNALVGWFGIKVRLEGGELVTKFYRVQRVVRGKYAGRVYVSAQASDTYYPVRTAASLKLVLGAIAADPVKAAMLYASELGRCCRCGRTLTDETSRSIGMGPECRSK